MFPSPIPARAQDEQPENNGVIGVSLWLVDQADVAWERCEETCRRLLSFTHHGEFYPLINEDQSDIPPDWWLVSSVLRMQRLE